MSDDLKLGVDISADLSKLDTSLQRAEQKVAASGQRMQKAATFNPSIGIGSSMTGSAAGGLQSAPHPNAVSFSSLNAKPGKPLTGGQQFANAVSGFLNQNVLGGGGGGVVGASGYTSGGGFGGMLGNSALFLQRNLMAGIATAAATVGTVEAVQKGTDVWTQMQLTSSTSSYRSHLQGLAAVQDSVRNIPIFGGILDYMSRDESNTNWRNTANVNEQNIALGRKIDRGLFGGGLAGDRRDLANERKLLADNRDEMMRQNVWDPVANNNYHKKDADLRMREAQNNIQIEQRSMNMENQISGNRLRAMGLGKYANIMDINRTYDEQIALASGNKDFKGDLPQFVAQLKRAKSSEVMAAIMSGLQPAQEISMSGSGAALAQGSVRMGSESGQSAEYLKQIAQNTGEDAPPQIGR